MPECLLPGAPGRNQRWPGSGYQPGSGLKSYDPSDPICRAADRIVARASARIRDRRVCWRSITFAALLMSAFALSYCGGGLPSPAFGHGHDAAYADWFNSLVMPGSIEPTSCCGVADQYYADSYEPSKASAGYRALVNGAWVEVPPNKIVRGQRNPTGRGVIFMTYPRDNGYEITEPFVYCFVPADEA